MSDEERRTIRALALLEVEEAKEHLALVRAKLDHWMQLHELVLHVLARGRRDGAQMEGAAEEARRALDLRRNDLSEVMDLEAVLALDDGSREAVARVKRAEAAKKALGFN